LIAETSCAAVDLGFSGVPNYATIAAAAMVVGESAFQSDGGAFIPFGLSNANSDTGRFASE
jgi:hypothetical protein